VETTGGSPGIEPARDSNGGFRRVETICGSRVFEVARSSNAGSERAETMCASRVFELACGADLHDPLSRGRLLVLFQ
jgi:hypothetical protein